MKSNAWRYWLYFTLHIITTLWSCCMVVGRRDSNKCTKMSGEKC